MDNLLEAFGSDTPHRIQAIFASLFILQNRLQTAGEKIQTQISMKQWLMLAMLGSCPEPRTLTRVGALMGCSRQNVKKLAQALEAQGYVKLTAGANNAVLLEMTGKAAGYAEEMAERHTETLRLLFRDFSEEELAELFRLYAKLYAGVERVEEYAKELDR